GAGHQPDRTGGLQVCCHKLSKRVLDNLKKLAAAGKKIIIRVPMIQGFNADETSVKAITDFGAEELHVIGIHFLPYH
ncbi:hypothetical protein QMQ04_31430, partial [Escherichia coli]|nr:hypothetical protein [Escherichia coli]